MIQVKVKNNINGREFKGVFETSIEADNWLQKHIKNNNFGLPERKVRQENKPDELEYKEVEKYKFDPNTYELVLDENGIPVVDGIEYEVTYPCEYTITKQETVTSLNAEEYLLKVEDSVEKILQLTDHTQLADCPLEAEIKKIFREYRQHLRNSNKQYDKNSIISFKLDNFESFYRKKYIEVSNNIIKKTSKINDKINKILE